jgi:hypothetical protein
MQWHELYPKEILPDMDALAAYMGDAEPLWRALMKNLSECGAKLKLTYSVCSGKPGWNVKFSKGGQALGTFYPEEGAFSALIVFSYRLDPALEAILPQLTPRMAEMVRSAGDYMKLGRWMMPRIDTPEALEDLLKLLAVKMKKG